MGLFRVKLIFIIYIFFVVSIYLNRAADGGRTPSTEKWVRTKQVDLLGSSLPRAPVPPSSGTSCTHIPGQGGGACTLNEKHFAGGGGAAARAPPASPATDMAVSLASA
ncbi:hypothetical protein ABFS82_14G023300 [Erythranthe guttata]